MSTRHYSSFLLRFWLESESGDEKESETLPRSMVLQVQNLQTGMTWRLTSLQELNELLDGSIANVLAGSTLEKGLVVADNLDGESE